MVIPFVEIFKKNVPVKLKRMVKSRLLGIYGKEYVSVCGINRDFTNAKQMKVLCLLASDVVITKYTHITHGVQVEFSVVLKSLIDMGYMIDIVDVRDSSMLENLEEESYDLIIGLCSAQAGKVFKTHQEAMKIFYSNGFRGSKAFEAEGARIRYFKERHPNFGKIFRRVAPVSIEQEIDYFKNMDKLLLIGGQRTKESYLGIVSEDKITCLNGVAIRNNFFVDNRDISTTKNKFVWFGSSGVILKGLDVIIDAFSMISNAELYIYGVSKEEEPFVRKLIKKSSASNIHLCSFVIIDSEEFCSLMNSISFFIFPSACEGNSGSGLTCMAHGLIPVVTKSAGLDFPTTTGIVLDNYDVLYIKDKIEEILGYDNKTVEEYHANVYRYVENKFYPDNMQNNISMFFREVTGEIAQKRKNI